MARPAGLEPATPGLEGRCSIQLSYGRNVTAALPDWKIGWSGQRDSNSRPSAPKADALPGCAMPRCQIFRHARPARAGPNAGCDHTAALPSNQAFIMAWPPSSSSGILPNLARCNSRKIDEKDCITSIGGPARHFRLYGRCRCCE